MDPIPATLIPGAALGLQPLATRLRAALDHMLPVAGIARTVGTHEFATGVIATLA